MPKKTIEVATRVEGHAKVSFLMDDTGEISQAHFHVTEFKGFEKFMIGRMLYDAPRITTRVCGICPVSHHLASVKTCENLLNVKIPETAKLLRELMHMGQFIHSHSLHFFFLAAPDFIIGPESDPSNRNVIGLLKNDPELVKKVIRIRKFGQDLIQLIGGKSIHPVTSIPGGMSKGISKQNQETVLKELKELIPIYDELLYICKSNLNQYSELISNFATFDSNYMGLTNKGAFELYDGDVRVADEKGNIISEFQPMNYAQNIMEHIEPWTYLKFPYLKIKGWPNGSYRVGPLARLNVTDGIKTPNANKELQEFKIMHGKPANQTLTYHKARLIEIQYAMERAQQILESPELLKDNIRVKTKIVAGEGIGIVEAPRGTLIHHYKANNSGKLTDINLIVATVNNNNAINKAVLLAAKGIDPRGNFKETDLNKIEMAIRAFDPCLTCAAHTSRGYFDIMEFYDRSGNLLKTIKR